MKSIFYRFLFIFIVLAGLFSCRKAALETDQTDLAQLLRPVDVSASAISPESIRIFWKAAAPSFNVEYSTVPDISSGVTVIEGVTGNEYLVTGLSEGLTYYFRVQGISDKEGRKSSEYSDIFYARTPVEPRIPNVSAESSMEYTVEPWSVTVTVVLTWGDPSLAPEAVSAVRMTPVAGGESLEFPVTSGQAAAQTVTVSDGIATDTEYEIELLVGDRVRGNVTHRTVPGPIPVLNVETVLDFDGVPVSAEADFSWTLYYVPLEDVSSISILSEGVEIMNVAVTDADRTAGHLLVEDLMPATGYSAVLKDAEGAEIAATSFTTPEAPDETMTVIRPEDDLMQVLADPDRVNETVYLTPGEHILDFSDESVVLAKSLEITADSPDNTTLRLTGGCMSAEGTVERIVFRNLKIICDTYLLQIKTLYNIGLYHVDGCVVDLNSGSTGNSTLFNTSNDAGSVLKEFIVSNSMVYANAGQTQYIVFQAASGSSASLEKLTLENSTFANCARGLVYTACTSDFPCNISIDNCTMYNVICAGGSQALLNVRYNGTANASNRSVSLTNSVIWAGNSTFRLLHFGAADAVGRIDTGNFWYFASQTPAYGSSAYDITDRLESYSGTPEQFWVSPAADPSLPETSFRIKDINVRTEMEMSGTVIGDPRWENR